MSAESISIWRAVGERERRLTFNCRLCLVFISCMRRYISVLLGSGCSQSVRGTLTESILGCSGAYSGSGLMILGNQGDWRERRRTQRLGKQI
jgi:hypothetical protein